MTGHSYQSIRESMLERIQSREWTLGERIPDETMLAEEYGCARTTINRALRELADAGLVVRKRKGGTRICEMPVRHATFEIPIIRDQVEAQGKAYQHQVLEREVLVPPVNIRQRLRILDEQEALLVKTIHLAGSKPYAYEVRWVNIKAVPQILEAPLNQVSANEWLVQTVPFSSGDVAFSAVSAEQEIADAIKCKIGAAIFVVDRTTWLKDEFITTMQLYYRQGYELYSKL